MLSQLVKHRYKCRTKFPVYVYSKRYQHSISNMFTESPTKELKYRITSKINKLEVSEKSINTVFNSLNQLSKTNSFHLPNQYKTKTKSNIIGIILSRVNGLLKNRYYYTRGENSTLLVGTKGIGKSTTLISTCIALTFITDKVIPVYVQYVDECKELTPSNLISKALIHRGIIINEINSITKLTQKLQENNIRILVVVDELDQLYQTKSREALTTLSDLAYMGSDASGRYCVIGCGSSAALPLLITKSAVHIPSLRDEYPLVIHSPNLNSSKFPSYRLGMGLLSNEELDIILRDRLNCKIITTNDRNVFRVFAGSNIRAIGSLCNILKNESLRISDIYQYIEPYSIHDSRTLKPISNKESLIKATYKRLIEKNRHLINKINNLDLDEILEQDWNSLNPLYIDDLNSILKTLKDKGVDVGLENYFTLVDSNWFIEDGYLNELYPQIPFHLLWENERLCNNKTKKLLHSLSKSLMKKIENRDILL